jgi:acetolactate synthase-1/2/3 large subunit
VNREMTTDYTGLNIRQLGDQEFNLVKTVQNMTKYAVQVNDPNEIRYHLEKACKLATTGRPGPVWLDVPLNTQSAEIDPDAIAGYEDEVAPSRPDTTKVDAVVDQWRKAKRPLLIVGNGVRLSGAVDDVHALLSQTNIPTITAVNGNDIVNSDYRYYYGRFGTHAQMCANKLLSECDFLLTIGSRLYVRQTGYNFKGFAQQAYRAYVDIDAGELQKPTLFPDVAIQSDAGEFIREIMKHDLPTTSKDWLDACDATNQFPKVLDRHRNTTDYVSHYAFIEELSKVLPNDHHIVTSDGSANVVTMQVMDLKGKQRLFTNTGCAPMGYGLPAALGAAVHHKVICLEGDGSLHLNIHELQTMKHYGLPIKLILLNNDGYLSIKITQNTFFNGRYVASEKSSGVSFPNFEHVIKAYGLPYCSIRTNRDIQPTLNEFLSQDGPCVCEVFTDPNETHEPKVAAKLGADGKFIPGELKDIRWVK